MGFLEATKSGLTRPFDFLGTSSRSEYWWFILAGVTIIPLSTVPLSVLAAFFAPAYFLILLYILYLFVVQWALLTRRLRDAGANLWLVLGGYFGASVVTGFFGMKDLSAITAQVPPAGPDAIPPEVLISAISMPTLIAYAIMTVLSLVIFVYTLLPSQE